VVAIRRGVVGGAVVESFPHAGFGQAGLFGFEEVVRVVAASAGAASVQKENRWLKRILPVPAFKVMLRNVLR